MRGGRGEGGWGDGSRGRGRGDWGEQGGWTEKRGDWGRERRDWEDDQLDMHRRQSLPTPLADVFSCQWCGKPSEHEQWRPQFCTQTVRSCRTSTPCCRWDTRQRGAAPLRGRDVQPSWTRVQPVLPAEVVAPPLLSMGAAISVGGGAQIDRLTVKMAFFFMKMVRISLFV